MTKFRIANVGTFDIENYGDLLFPELLSSALESRGLEIDLVRFGPIGTTSVDKFLPKALPLSALEAEHHSQPFDAVVVGGGALVHFNKIYQALPGRNDMSGNEMYAVYETWVAPSFFALKYGVPLIWNAPDVPFEFPLELRGIARILVSACQMICVRNVSSAKNIGLLGDLGSDVRIVPDTALCLPRYLKFCSDNSPCEAKNYTVVHINSYISELDLSALAAEINAHSHRSGQKIVLLPLAHTHRDQEKLLVLSSFLICDHVVMETRSILEMAAVIKNAGLYLGVSFHGAITAISYGVPAIGFNYMKYAKTNDLFESLCMDAWCVESVAELSFLLPLAEQGSQRCLNLAEQQEKIEAHFDEIASVLSFSRASGPSLVRAVHGYSSVAVQSALLGAISDLVEGQAKQRFQIQHLLDKSRWLEETLAAMRGDAR